MDEAPITCDCAPGSVQYGGLEDGCVDKAWWRVLKYADQPEIFVLAASERKAQRNAPMGNYLHVGRVQNIFPAYAISRTRQQIRRFRLPGYVINEVVAPRQSR